MNPKTPNFDAMLAAVDGALGEMKDLPVSVKVVLSNRRGEVLVLKDARSDWNDLPGGHVHPGEDFAAALEREVFEETGLRLDPVSVARDGVPEQHVLGNRPASVVWFTAAALGDDGELSLSDEHSGAEWVRPWNLDNYNLGVLLPKASALATALATVEPRSRPVAASAPVRAAQVATVAGEPVSHHETARRAAERIYKAAADNWLAQLNADLVAAIFGHKLMDYDGAWAAVYGAAAGGWGEAMEGAGRKAYAVTARTLGHDANVTHNPNEEALKGFAAGRKDLLSKFPQAVRDKVAASLKRGVAAGEDARALARRAAESIDEISDGPTKRLAATEAQATYGLAQSEVLELAGYRLKVWRTVGDDRVRDSHYLCESQGAIPASTPFHNGLMYPGDPNGGPEEVCNCRCNLEGVN